ncbi:MAG: sensor histidine kinase [Anaerolineales bacterium]|nr:MAG: sensor histidine kinase [Anaerolineales bacterium]
MEYETATLTVVFFFSGVAFFSMGIAIVLEGGRSSDERLRLSLRPLAVFGILHGIHEWMDMFENTGLFRDNQEVSSLWFGVKLALLAISFLSLSGFGFSLLAPNTRIRRLSLLAPLGLATIWGYGLLVLMGRYTITPEECQVACVWTRYALGIPSALAASVGLIAQQRAFRRAGMARFGRDSLVAAIAFAWYGIVGQLFVTPSRLPPSTFLNEDLFFFWFRFPIQFLRAVLAILVAVYVIRFMRAFDTEIKRQISELQTLRLHEAERREELRGRLLARIVAAQEAERQRIARELHDDTGQTLTAIGLGLRGIASSLESDTDKAAHNLLQLEALSATALDELQRIIANLRPAHLDDLGLPAALRWYLKNTRNHTELDINFRVDGDEEALPDAVKIAIYRIVQEAITNTIKHAEANTFNVVLSYGDENVELWIDDDGKGMDMYQIEREDRQSWGLLGMRERASLLNGKFLIDSELEKGVMIHVTIPYQQPEEEFDQTLEVTDDDTISIGG